MKYKYYIMIGIAVMLVGVVALSGCVQNPRKTTPNQTQNQSNASKYTVMIQNFAFTPNNIVVKAGTNVTWINKDQDLHDVTSDSGAFESRDLKKGESYTHNFTKPGEYPYFCDEHPSMTAKVIVK